MLHFGAANQCPNVYGQTILKSTGSTVHLHSLTIMVADVDSVDFVDDCDAVVVGEVDVACFAGVVVAFVVKFAELIVPLEIVNFFAEE